MKARSTLEPMQKAAEAIPTPSALAAEEPPLGRSPGMAARPAGSVRRLVAAVARLASSLLLVLLIAALAFMLLGPRLMGLQLLTVYGPSMEPAVPLGSLIVVQPVQAAQVSVGDVIVYRSSAGQQWFVTHRVIEIIPGQPSPSFRTQGDANPNPDSWPVPPSLLVGRVALHVPLLGYLIHYARTPLGAALILLALAAIGASIISEESAQVGGAARGRKGKTQTAPPAPPWQRLGTWLLLLAISATGAAGVRTGNARGGFSDTATGHAYLSVGVWTVPTTLSVSAAGEGLAWWEPSPPKDGVEQTWEGDLAEPSPPAAMPRYCVRGQIEIANTGRVAAEGLAVSAQVQCRQEDSGFQDLVGASQSWSMESLAAGATLTVPFDIAFEPPDAAAYRVLVQVTITNHEGHLGQPYGPEVAATFSLAAPADPLPMPTDEATPAPTREAPPLPTDEPTPTPTKEAPPLPTDEPTPTPTKEAPPLPTDEPTPTATKEAPPLPTDEPTPTPTKEAPPLPTDEPTPTEEATPTRTEEPPATPEPTSEHA